MNYFYLGKKENEKYLQNNWIGIYGNLNPKGVVLHDGASGMGASAETTARRTATEMASNHDYPNYHNVIDDKCNCYSVIREDRCAYHSGDGNGNSNYIGIEIAPTLTGGDFNNQADKDKYYKAWKEACKLVADYCVKYNLSPSTVKQHCQFSATACPYTMNKYFGSYDKALTETRKEVAKNIKIIKGETVSNSNIDQYTEVVETLKRAKYQYITKPIKDGVIYKKNSNGNYTIATTNGAKIRVKEFANSKGHLPATRYVETIEINGATRYMHSFIDNIGIERYLIYKIVK